MEILKTYFSNLKHLPSTGAAVMTILTYCANSYFKLVPKEVIDSAMMLLGPLVLAIFVGGKVAQK